MILSSLSWLEVSFQLNQMMNKLPLKLQNNKHQLFNGKMPPMMMVKRRKKTKTATTLFMESSSRVVMT